MNSWNLTNLYTSLESEDFINDLKQLEAKVNEYNNLKATFNNTAVALENYILTLQDLYSRFRKLMAFISLTLATDTTNELASKYEFQIAKLSSTTKATATAADKWIATLDIESLAKESELIREHLFYLNQIKDSERYSLDEKTEVLLSKLSQDGATAFSKLHGLLTSTMDVEYEGQTITLSEVRNKAFSADSVERKKGYEAEMASYKKVDKSIAASLNSIKGWALTVAELRGFSSPLEQTLYQSNMTQETLDALLDAIKEYLPVFREYLQCKARILGHSNGLPFYDIFAPIGANSRKYSIQDAEDYVFNAFNDFSPRLGGLAKKAFDNKWVDYTPKKGKRGGAFCSNIPPLKESRILMNFDGSFKNVMTLAHELGHAYHGECIFSESILNSSYSMPVAETASIMAENIVINKALADATPEEKIALLENDLESVTVVCVDILSRFIFESEVFERRKSKTLNEKELCQIMVDAQKETYGDSLDQDALHPYAWLNKVHYYSPSLHYYNFPYAFGSLFGKGLYAQYLKDKATFVGKYDEMLRLTGQLSVEDAAKVLGVDVTDKNFWRQSLEMVKAQVEQLILLTK